MCNYNIATSLCCFMLMLSAHGFSSSDVDCIPVNKILDYGAVSQTHFNDTSIVFEISADAHGFMCPFLTPMFMNRLKAEGAIEVSKSEDLTITAVFPITSIVSEESLRNWAAMVGYEKDKVHARKK